MPLSEFEKKVLQVIKRIPFGKVATYRGVARAVGRPKAMRAVGNALNKNPQAPRVPCHRVVKSNGEVGGYACGMKKKRELLEKEGIIFEKGKILDFKKVLYKF